MGNQPKPTVVDASKYRFSVITPAYIHSEERKDGFMRCIDSLYGQTFKNFEHVVIDDGSPIEIKSDWLRKNEYSLLLKPDHLERVLALREGFQMAAGEWICLLDSDDAYLPHALETMDRVIKENPDYSMFNFGSVHVHANKKVSVRDSFRPKMLDVGHEVFGGGNIVNGTFIFKRSLLRKYGDFPKAEGLWNPWDFSIAAQNEFPEIQQYFMVPNEEIGRKVAKELGNPWGQDYYLFYKFTRFVHSMPREEHLYVVYHR